MTTEVVRCKDCQYRHSPLECALWYGSYNDTEYFIDHGDDFFCSYGKRKELEDVNEENR